ncbi:MAG: PhzF family phenazine biosynthesis protein [Planctomycetota bacterium]|nr:PhzF family phenazine biosynthesis protein [Planctomycetota bacterium]
MSELPLYVIDAFADQAFRGNPAAVCILDPDVPCSDEWMQAVAAEMNLSETAFVDFSQKSLRWFTPRSEVDLCGHATLATARALKEHELVAEGDLLEFRTRSGPLTALVHAGGKIELEFPATPASELEPVPELVKLFPGANFFGQSRFDLLVELESQQQLEELEPDFHRLTQLPYRGVIVTAPSALPEFDFVSRFFAPAVGVNEDPVTGSAHCCLAPYWGQRLASSRMTAAQLSSRKGVITVELVEDRVRLTGDTVLVIKGKLFPDAHS